MAEDALATPSSLPQRDLSGRMLGDYRLLRRLGRGAMAEVYLAEQASLRRQVAVKVLRDSLAGDATYLRRFQHEAEAAASLTHANIVQIYQVGQVDGIHFIVQEYVAGQNLKDFLHRHGPPELGLAVHLMRQVVAALARAAEQGIVHRDIKPENIMLARSGEVKVADFGLARVYGAAVNLTQVGVTMGTPLYMSPEQVEGKPLDPRSDLYSLGVTCYQMLSGRVPFEGESPLAIAVQHLKTPPLALESLRPDLPPGLCRIVHRLLAKNPDDRYASPRDVLRDLRGLDLPASDYEWPLDAALELGDDDPQWKQAHQARTQATRHLAAVIARQVPPARSPRRGWAVGLVLACGLLCGLGLAWWLRPTPLLAGADPGRTQVAPQKSALDQLFHASTLGTEEAWLSVRQYFPEEEFYGRLADQQLARLYLNRGEDARALEMFHNFANLEATEESFRAFGLAGECVISSYRGDHARSAQLFAELLPLRRHLDPEMARLVARAAERNRDTRAQEWSNWVAGREASGE